VGASGQQPLGTVLVLGAVIRACFRSKEGSAGVASGRGYEVVLGQVWVKKSRGGQGPGSCTMAAALAHNTAAEASRVHARVRALLWLVELQSAVSSAWCA
jgi:hypothetical protein